MRLLFSILLFLVVLSPLPFGTRAPWAWSLMAIAVALLLGFWSFRLYLTGARVPVGLDRTWPIVVPFLLVLGWVVLQVSGLTPESWHHPMWGEAARVLGEDVGGAVSVNPAAGYDGILRLLMFGGIFWLSLQFGRDSELAYKALRLIAVAGILYAAYGLAAQFLGGEKILWFEKRFYRGSVTGTMEYKNAFATYAALGLIATTGLLFQILNRASADSMGPRDRLRRVASRVLERGWKYALGSFILISALLLANSRGGMIAAIAGVGALVLSYGYLAGSQSRPVKLAGAAVVALGAGLVLFSGADNIERIDRLSMETDTRTLIYAQTMDGIADSPLLGTGYRTFPQAFAMYNTPRISGTVHRAHNVYLDNAMGLGVPAALLLLLPIAAMAVMCLRGLFRRQRNAVYPCIGLAATVTVAVHGLFDFTLQVPAVMATYMLIMGIACAQSWSTREG